MDKELDTMKLPDFGDKRDKEVDELLKKWRRRHVGQIVAPVGGEYLECGRRTELLV